MTPWAARLATWWAHRRLRRGQCPECGRVLPDDAPPGSLCSTDCTDTDAEFWRTW